MIEHVVRRAIRNFQSDGLRKIPVDIFSIQASHEHNGVAFECQSYAILAYFDSVELTGALELLEALNILKAVSQLNLFYRLAYPLQQFFGSDVL